MFVSGFFHPESFISLGISAAAMDDSQLDEEQRAPSAGPVQQVLFHLVPVSRTQSVDAFFAAQTGEAVAAAAADFFAANNMDAFFAAQTGGAAAAAAADFFAANKNIYSVPVPKTQSVDAFFAAQTGGASAAAAADFFAANKNIYSVPVAKTQSVDALLTDRSRAAVLNLLAEISEYHANNKNKVAAGVPFSNFSKYSLPTTPEADAVSVEVIFFVCFFYNKF
jgi:hypothetical protein